MAININTKRHNITWLGEESRDIGFKDKTFTPEELEKNLEYLDTLVHEATRQLDFWDIYKFASALEDPNKFDQQYSALVNNTAMVINCGTQFTYNGETYKTGDVVIKDDHGEMIHIKAVSNGIFYPAEVETDGNKLNITYKFLEQISEDELGRIGFEKDESGNYYKEVELEDNDDGICYGEELSNNSNSSWTYQFPIKTYEGNKVTPVIKCFHKNDDGTFEEVFCYIVRTEVSGSEGPAWSITLPGFVNHVTIK